MILFLFVLAGFLAACAANCRRGTANQYGNISSVRGLWLPVAGLLAELPFSYLPAFAGKVPWLFTGLSYLCIIMFLILNRRRAAGAILAGAGTLCNLLVILCNNFRMPVSPLALAMFPGMTPEAVYAKKANYFVATHGARFYFLGDIIPVRIPYVGSFISVGDILLGLGITAFIFSVLTETLSPSRSPSAE
ncbi:DUF5317 family protein [Caproiciproducens faecalis]|uniref:DUF5317 domain-containing protein n=1 Tax=Caproiciproducens faecalis TaxID=2820301 RepID=A0ABS7DMU4_9FIRM|nr:DUF5317 family protein [Caproiciproducens faecalis]MBW7572619.1 DUF5317 domain-containing protein [Caproiciproducens faecalis]